MINFHTSCRDFSYISLSHFTPWFWVYYPLLNINVRWLTGQWKEKHDKWPSLCVKLNLYAQKYRSNTNGFSSFSKPPFDGFLITLGTDWENCTSTPHTTSKLWCFFHSVSSRLPMWNGIFGWRSQFSVKGSFAILIWLTLPKGEGGGYNNWDSTRHEEKLKHPPMDDTGAGYCDVEG